MRGGASLFVGAILLLTPLGWTLTDHLEAQKGFCGSCHLDPVTGLHARKLENFAAVPVRTLSAAHGQAAEELGCIDCHRGTGILGRARVKVVAARDAALYLLGRFGEPEEMQHPLWDDDCLRCHPSYEPLRDDAFHAFAAHNAEFPNRCVECHVSHREDGDPQLNYLTREVVLPLCRNCHEEL